MNRLDVLRTATRDEIAQLTDEELLKFQREYHKRVMRVRRKIRKEKANDAKGHAKKCNNQAS